jgi:hypothetical protein
LSGQLSRISGAEEVLGPGVTIAGNQIAFVRESHLIDIWRADLTAPAVPGSPLIASTRMQLVPQYSPDGARVAFQSTRSGTSEIWLADADGSNPVKLTSFNGPLTGAPSWCNDGRRVAFDSRASGVSAIYESALQGMPYLKYSDSWTATRRGVYYTQSGTQAATVGFYDFASRHAHVVRDLHEIPAPLGGLGISVSNDEHWLLYTRNAQWQGDVMMISGF